MQQFLVERQVFRHAAPCKFRGIGHHVLAQDGEGCDITAGVDEPFQPLAVESVGLGEARQPRVAIDEQRLLHLVQHLVLHVLGHLGLEQIEAEPVDGADVHLGEAGHLAERLAATLVDALLEFGGGLVGEGEGDDVRGCAAAATVLHEVSSVTTRRATTSVLPEPAHAIS